MPATDFARFVGAGTTNAVPTVYHTRQRGWDVTHSVVDDAVVLRGEILGAPEIIRLKITTNDARAFAHDIDKAIWDLTLAMTANATLPDNVRQIAILVVGARFDAAYEIYAHIAVAEREGMKPERLATLVADLKPNDLTPEESIAFDLAYALVRGGTLPEPLYRLAVDTFGQHGANELIYLVGLYCLVSTTLNGFNIPVPERE